MDPRLERVNPQQGHALIWPKSGFTGREAIAAGYAFQPPSDTLTVTRGVSSGDVDELCFAWDSSGTTGTMILHWHGGLIAELTVTFD